METTRRGRRWRNFPRCITQFLDGNEIPNKFLSQIYRQLAAETFKKRVYKAGLAQAAKAAIPTTSTAGKYATNQQVSQTTFHPNYCTLH